MTDAATKHLSFKGGIVITDLRSLRSVLKSKRTVSFAYGFMFAFVLFTVFLAFSPSTNSSSPWFINMFSTGAATATAAGSQFSSFFSYFSSNSYNNTGIASPQQRQEKINDLVPQPAQNATINRSKPIGESQSSNTSTIVKSQSTVNNVTQSTGDSVKPTVLQPKQSKNSSIVSEGPSVANTTTQTAEKSIRDQTSLNPNQTTAAATKAPVPSNQSATANSPANQTTTAAPKSQNDISSLPTKSDSLETENSGNQGKSVPTESVQSNYSASLAKKQSDETKQSNATSTVLNQELETLVDKLLHCDMFDGQWVKDESYPLYKPGSCSLIDQQFNCIVNGRPDKDYQKYKWKPKACTLPRLNPAHMLELLKGKRLAFVGDSLNRNMWESLVCMLRGSAKNQSNVYEANGRQHFRGEASYSFIFKDYGCSVEFFVTPFLVQEWEMRDKNGLKKETLRLDLVGRSSSLYKDADIIVFNTGHWWSHDKTSKGKDYYQEGSHVYDELNVLEAFRKALTTWGRWVDANINPTKSHVMFRGYSVSHFSGGQWNSGGACDSEVEPIKNETYLREYPPKMLVLERVLRGMKTHVTYMNVSQMTDYRKDAHPSIYRRQNLAEEERGSPLRYQDCSHWCLPGVPDAWNEILYAELLINERQKLQVQKRHR